MVYSVSTPISIITRLARYHNNFKCLNIAGYTQTNHLITRQPGYQMGTLGVEELLERIDNGSKPPVHRLLELALIVRGSVSAPRGIGWSVPSEV